jgi:DNA-binding NtrC family response regulator
MAEVKASHLREDLYYRLNVVPVHLPPLRERPEDIPVLGQCFLERFSEKYGKYFVDFSPEALEVMLRYDWPGNVRELQNTIERIVVLVNASQVAAQHFPENVLTAAGRHALPALDIEGVQRGVEEVVEADSEILSIEEVERRAIINAVRKCGGDLSMTARKLGISRATLYRKLDKYDIR